MSSIEVKTFDKADEVVDKFNNAKIEAVKVGGQRVVRLHLKPGWRWSTDVKPHIGTDSCQANHIGIITKGTVFCKNMMMEQRLVILLEILILSSRAMTLGLLVTNLLKHTNLQEFGANNGKIIGNFEVNDWVHWKKCLTNILMQEKPQELRQFMLEMK